MFRLTLATIRAKKARFLLTAVAVILGVAFMAGTLVLTDTIKKSYDDLAGNVYEGTDAVVRSSRSQNDANGTEQRASIDAALLEQIRSVDGVAAAEPQLLGVAMVVDGNGELLENSPNRPVPVAFSWQSDSRLNPMDLVDGHAPGDGEIVIDKASAEAGDFAVGDVIQVVAKNGTHEYTLAGIGTYGGENDAAGAQVVAFAPETAAVTLGEPGRFDAIHVVAEPGMTEANVARSLEVALADADVDVITGAEATDEAREATGAQMTFLSTFLLTFAIVAMVVGSFVIYNTFSITVAQRTKETALLRAIGAKRKQVMRSIVFESFLTGVFASAIGVAAGIGTAKGIAQVFTLFDIDLPATSLVVKSSTIVTSMVVGIVVTVMAAYLPARRSGKVAPIAALRDVAIDRSGSSVKRTVAGVVVTGAGAIFMSMGLGSADVGAVGLGAFAIFVGVAVLGPVLARPFTKLIGAPLTLRGVTGRISRENASRNPRRTSATASALMIGVGLVMFITVFAASTKASINKSIDTTVHSDWIVETAYGMGGLSPDAADRIDALPETGSVSRMRYASATIDGSARSLTAFDTEAFAGSLRLQPVTGDLSALGAGGLAVSTGVAEENGWAVGDTVTLTFVETGDQAFTVAAVFGDTGPTDGYVISLEAFDANVADRVDNYLMVDTAEGFDTEVARAAMNEVLDEYPNASVRTQDEFKGTIAAEIDSMLNLIYVLLIMALVIALFGVANTLALSVVERTREIGLLRAVGMSRGQLRATVRWESALIGLLGTSLGTAIGLGFGWALVQAIPDTDVDTFTVPVTQIAWIVGLAAVAAVVAAALPARRAARLDVLAAVSSD